MTYIPNLNDPRIRRRFNDAFGFTKACLNGRNPRRWHGKVIDKHFGRQDTDIGALLRTALLICSSHSYQFGTANSFCKEYIQNSTGAALIRAVLKGILTDGAELIELIKQIPSSFTRPSRPTEHIGFDIDVKSDKDTEEDIIYDEEVCYQWAKREFSAEILAGTFEYNFKSNRHWNPIQNVKNSIRSRLFAECGFKINLDASTAAPCLIMQDAQRHGHDEYMFGISDYINNKQEYRQYVSDLLGLDAKKTKMLINSLFCGARLGANKHFVLYGFIFDYDKEKIELAKNDERLKLLRSDISNCWKAISPSMMRISENGRLKPLSSKQKWSRYFQLECTMMNAVRDYAKMTGNTIFTEHDGFKAKNEVNGEELEQFVLDKTGFRITFE